MAYEFQKLSEVEVLAEVPEGATVLTEVNGDIKRVPGAGLGGNSGKVLIIVCSPEEAAPKISDGSSLTVTANMTLQELYESLYNHELTGAYAYLNNSGAISMDILLIQDMTLNVGQTCIAALGMGGNTTFFFTENGISMDPPSGDK